MIDVSRLCEPGSLMPIAIALASKEDQRQRVHQIPHAERIINHSAAHLPSLKLTACTWKLMVGRLISFWEGLFSGAFAVRFRERISISIRHLFFRKLHILTSCQTVTMDVGTLMVELDLLAKLLCLFSQPIKSMYGIFIYLQLVDIYSYLVGKYTIHTWILWVRFYFVPG